MFENLNFLVSVSLLNSASSSRIIIKNQEQNKLVKNIFRCKFILKSTLNVNPKSDLVNQYRDVMERLLKVLIIYCCVSTVIYFQYQRSQVQAVRKSEGKERNEYEVALELQREWNNVGNFTRQTKIIIPSYWRSGSSFLGGIFESSPDVMYIYEPFHDLGGRIIRNQNTQK